VASNGETIVKAAMKAAENFSRESNREIINGEKMKARKLMAIIWQRIMAYVNISNNGVSII
jgi:hypothetical protein